MQQHTSFTPVPGILAIFPRLLPARAAPPLRAKRLRASAPPSQPGGTLWRMCGGHLGNELQAGSLPSVGPVARARMATPMTNAHRQFLQALMSLGIMESGQAIALHQHCCELHQVYYATDKLDEFINVANLQLQPLFLEIRKGMAEDTGRTWFALVNLAESEVTRMASDYTETELELFKKTMDLIVLSENGFASSTEILNVADQLTPKKMKKREAEQVLQHLVQDKWLAEREGEFTLHTRCILELEQYILSHYPDTARKCHMCHTLVIQSQVCRDCGIAMHSPCLARYFQVQTEPRCPHCKQLWPHRVPGVRVSKPPVGSRGGTFCN